MNYDNIKRQDLTDVIKGSTYQGASFDIAVNGAPLDLTGALIRIDMKVSKDETEYAKQFTTEDGSITISGTTAGQFLIPPQIIDIPAFNYIYDVKITLLSGVVKVYVWGYFQVLQNVTD